MPVITLTSDFGLQDYYSALIKGGILCQNQQVTIVDITHNIENYNIVQAAFIFKNAWRGFPKNSIHLVCVNCFYEKDPRFVALHVDDQYFIGPDNGLFSLIFDTLPGEVYFLDLPPEGEFPLKELLANAVAHIIGNRPFNQIGAPANHINQRITFQPVIGPSQIRGSVIHIDHYENVILNISRELFEQVGKGRPFSLIFKRHDPITLLSRQYHDVPIGDPLCLFNSTGYLEIAINMGKAGSLLGLKIEDMVQVDFKNSEK